MPLPPKIHAKYIARFDELIKEGQEIINAIGKRRVPLAFRNVFSDDGFGECHQETEYTEEDVVDRQRFYKWLTNCSALFAQVVSENHPLQKHVATLDKHGISRESLEYGISQLQAVKEDFEKGFLDDILLEIESELAADYMDQAKQLLSEGQSGKYDHVPAAVLSGAVLEKALRTLCDQQSPPIATIKPNGEFKTLNPLIDDLKKAKLYNEAKAKQLRGWADIRNHAAHGRFDQFNRDDVMLMIKGINNFLAEYLK